MSGIMQMLVGGKVALAIPLLYSPSVWFDATDASTITATGSRVTQWNDKSGNARHVTNATTGPSTGVQNISGKNALGFASASSNSLTSSSSTGFINAANQTFTAFAVFRATNMAITRLIMSLDGPVTPRMPQIMRTEVGNVLQMIRIDPTIVGESSAATLTTTSAFIGTTIYTTASLNALINGVGNGVTAAGSNAVNQNRSLAIGMNGGYGDALFEGYMGELILYPTVLTNAEINVIGNYLATKWSISWTNL